MSLDNVTSLIKHGLEGIGIRTLDVLSLDFDGNVEAEADRLCNAGRYERTAARRDQRSGSYDRKLQTKAGAVTLKVPKLR